MDDRRLLRSVGEQQQASLVNPGILAPFPLDRDIDEVGARAEPQLPHDQVRVLNASSRFADGAPFELDAEAGVQAKLISSVYPFGFLREIAVGISIYVETLPSKTSQTRARASGPKTRRQYLGLAL